MNSKNLLIPRRKSPYKMDPTSDRYRECPNDGVQFMAIHRSAKFCCDPCADEFHNQNRLDAEKLMQNEIVVALQAPVPIQEKVVLQLAEAKVETTVETKVQTKVEAKIIIQTSTVVATPLVVNVNLIVATLGDSPSVTVYKNYLTARGFEYGVYESKYQIPGTELNVLTYGPYAIAWGYEQHIIITYKTNIPWIQ